jgi:hypothetical protein
MLPSSGLGIDQSQSSDELFLLVKEVIVGREWFGRRNSDKRNRIRRRRVRSSRRKRIGSLSFLGDFL